MSSTSTRSILFRALALLACIAIGAAIVPCTVASWSADAYFDGDRDMQRALTREVIAYVERAPSPDAFHTGSALFDGEWAFGTYSMTILGLGHVALEHPELTAELVPVMRRAADRMLAPETLAFGAGRWGVSDVLADAAADPDHGHAYLGYANIALGILRRVDPDGPHAAIHDRLTATLADHVARAPHALVLTYPGEGYPCDTAAVLGSIGLHARATGRSDRDSMLRGALATYRQRWVHSTGYLWQSGDVHSGQPVDHPRGSGTALSAYFLSFADRDLARALYRAIAARGERSLLGFSGVLEYAAGYSGGGDIDSGPTVLGVSVSATGFAIAAARGAGDRALYTRLYRTAWLFGVPIQRGEGVRFLAGGPLGNAIMLAMLTAPREAM